MATQSVEFRAVTGQTITAKLFTVGSDTEVASVTATEATNRKGTYTATFEDVAAGEYQLLAFNATPIPVASWLVTLTLTTATFQVYDRVDKDGITRSNWAALTVDHTSTGSFGYVIGLLFGLIENVTGWRFTSKALEQSPSGSGASVVVGPLVQTNSQRTQPAYIETYQYDRSTLGPFRLEDSESNQYDLAGIADWILIVWDKDDNELGVVAYADLAITSSTNNAVMDQYSFAPVAGQVANAGRQRFALRRPQGTSEQTAAAGIFNVIATPRGPTL